MKRAFCLGVVVALIAASGCRNSPQPVDPFRQKVESLIAKLRSSNPPINPKREPWVEEPGVQSVADEGWEAAREQLIVLGKLAFPVLIEHVNDTAYSCSRLSAIMADLSVGQVCFEIIEQQVDLAGLMYKSRTGADGQRHGPPAYFWQICGSDRFTDDGLRKCLRKWWEAHKGQSLREMQIEALRQRIEDERKIGFSDEESKERFLNPLVERLKKIEGH
jgi:hypothetical protein